MTRFDLLHEHSGPVDELAEKYGVPTYNEYKAWSRQHVSVQNPVAMSQAQSWTPIQRLAFALVYRLHCFGEKPRYFILNHKFVLELYHHLNGEMISEFEGVPLTHDEHQLPNIASL